MVQETGWLVKRQRRTRSALGAVAVVLVLVGSAAFLWIDHRNDGEVTAAERGNLTPDQYAAAVKIARSDLARYRGTVTAAAAMLVKAPPTGCNPAGRLLVVQVIGHFNVQVSFADGAPDGPDVRIIERANPADNIVCSSGVSFGRFKPPAAWANLLPGLAASLLPAL